MNTTHSYNPLKFAVRISNEIRTLLVLTGASLAEGESTRDYVCPFCDGGQSNEKAFVLTRADGNLLFVCHRASCARSGVLPGRSGLGDDGVLPRPNVDKEKGRRYEGPLERLLPYQLKLLSTNYGLSPSEIDYCGIMWAPQASRLALPVRSATGRLRGYMLRGLANWQVKWEGWQENTDDPWMGWYKGTFGREASPLVVVEDQFSAIKASRFYPCVALLGTNFNLQKVLEIQATIAPNTRVVMCLDRDAYGKSIKAIEQWALYMDGNYSVRALSKDLKYMTDGEIISTISNKESGI